VIRAIATSPPAAAAHLIDLRRARWPWSCFNQLTATPLRPLRRQRRDPVGGTPPRSAQRCCGTTDHRRESSPGAPSSVWSAPTTCTRPRGYLIAHRPPRSRIAVIRRLGRRRCGSRDADRSVRLSECRRYRSSLCAAAAHRAPRRVRKEHGELVALVPSCARSWRPRRACTDRQTSDRAFWPALRLRSRTEIVPSDGELDLEQLIPKRTWVISITQNGLTQRVAASTYPIEKPSPPPPPPPAQKPPPPHRPPASPPTQPPPTPQKNTPPPAPPPQRPRGRGRDGMDTNDDDGIEHLLVVSTHDYGPLLHQLCFLPAQGARFARGNRPWSRPPARQPAPVREGTRRTVIATRDFTRECT